MLIALRVEVAKLEMQFIEIKLNKQDFPEFLPKETTLQIGTSGTLKAGHAPKDLCTLTMTSSSGDELTELFSSAIHGMYNAVFLYQLLCLLIQLMQTEVGLSSTYTILSGKSALSYRKDKNLKSNHPTLQSVIHGGIGQKVAPQYTLMFRPQKTMTKVSR